MARRKRLILRSRSEIPGDALILPIAVAGRLAAFRPAMFVAALAFRRLGQRRAWRQISGRLHIWRAFGHRLVILGVAAPAFPAWARKRQDDERHANAADPPGVAARRVALRLLDAVLAQRPAARRAARRHGPCSRQARGPRPRPRHRRRGAAPSARSRCADRSRHANEARRRRQGARRAARRFGAGAAPARAVARRHRHRSAFGRRRPAPARPWRVRHGDAAGLDAPRPAQPARPTSRNAGTRHGAKRR